MAILVRSKVRETATLLWKLRGTTLYNITIYTLYSRIVIRNEEKIVSRKNYMHTHKRDDEYRKFESFQFSFLPYEHATLN